MRGRHLILPVIGMLASLSTPARAGIVLGTAGDFAVLAGSTVTNTGPSVIDGGDVGVSPGTSITGFGGAGNGTLLAPYTFHAGDALAAQAQTDLTTAYNAAAALTPTQVLTGQNLGGMTLTPGVYFFASSAQLTGTLTLDNNTNNPNAQFVFQIGSTLTTASGSSVVMTGAGSSVPGCNVFWQVGSSATLGTTTAFEGHILAYSSITLNTGATILDGSALARTGAVTLDTNTITNCVSVNSVPEPTTMALALISTAMLGLPTIKRQLRIRSRSRPASRRPIDAG
ncbi:MAG: ice-binding family protein [Isosphaeraceae bacterium]